MLRKGRDCRDEHPRKGSMYAHLSFLCPGATVKASMKDEWLGPLSCGYVAPLSQLTEVARACSVTRHKNVLV